MRELVRFRRNTDGVVAIEAVLVIPVFLMVVFSIFEVGHVFYKTAMIEQATAVNARPIKTGTAFVVGDYANAAPGQCASGRECYFDDFCQSVAMFGDCSENLSVEVKKFDSFEKLLEDDTTAKCPNGTGYKAEDQLYQPGEANDIIRITSCFTLKVFNPALGLSLGTTGDGKRAVIAVQVQRNEPYSAKGQPNPNVVPASQS